MKLTQNQLRKLILQEARHEKAGPDLYAGVSANELLRFSKRYMKLGPAITEQLDDILARDYEVNPNAIARIKELLYGYNLQIDQAIDSYYRFLDDENEDE